MTHLNLKKVLISLFALTMCVTSYAADVKNRTPKVVIGTYVSAQNGEIKIQGNDGNVYMLDRKSIDSSVTIRDGYDKVNVASTDGIKELKVGSTVIINIKGVVFVEIKEPTKK